jgi:hypothetical protein
LDVIPLAPLDSIVSGRPYVFDRCSRRGVVANDFFYVPPGGLPGLLEFCADRCAHVEAKSIYKQWKMRGIFYGTGPDCFTAYLKKKGLTSYCLALSDRIFPQSRRNVYSNCPMLRIEHQLSWVGEVRQVQGTSGEVSGSSAAPATQASGQRREKGR